MQFYLIVTVDDGSLADEIGQAIRRGAFLALGKLESDGLVPPVNSTIELGEQFSSVKSLACCQDLQLHRVA